jgi:hypothetical protein
MKKHITKKVKNYDHLNQMELRSDIENGNIIDTYLEAEGKISNEPKTWGIVVTIKDGTIIENYLYQSKFEYEQDLSILGLLKEK